MLRRPERGSIGAANPLLDRAQSKIVSLGGTMFSGLALLFHIRIALISGVCRAFRVQS